MMLNVILKRNEFMEGIGQRIREKSDFSRAKFCFVLVIKNAKDEEWLAGSKAELEERLFRWRKLWDAEVIVLNESLAMEYGLIAGNA